MHSFIHSKLSLLHTLYVPGIVLVADPRHAGKRLIHCYVPKSNNLHLNNSKTSTIHAQMWTLLFSWIYVLHSYFHILVNSTSTPQITQVRIILLIPQIKLVKTIFQFCIFNISLVKPLFSISIVTALVLRQSFLIFLEQSMAYTRQPRHICRMNLWIKECKNE